MPTKCDKNLIVKPDLANFEQVRTFIEKELNNFKLSQQIIQENVLLAEELFIVICEKALPSCDIVVRITKNLGALYIKIEYDGDRFELDVDDASDVNLGNRIIGRYAEKISWRFRRRHNSINILVSRRMSRNFKQSLVMAVAGIIIGQILVLLLSPYRQNNIMSIATEAETIFAYLMIMISAPVTFFSIVTNCTNISVYIEKTVSIKRLLIDIFNTSIIALLVGTVMARLLSNIFLFDGAGVDEQVELELFEYGSAMVPKDIFEAFTVLSPFPLIILSLVSAIALINMKSHFQQMKTINDSINEFIQSALEIIYYLLPVAVFFTFMDLSMCDDIEGFIVRLCFISLPYICTLVMYCLYGIRLMINGINPILFIKDCSTAIRENYNIGSPISAIPYNIRFCNKILGIRIKRLDDEVPILSQLNYDGNCVILMMVTVFCLLVSNVHISVSDYFAIGFLVLALSVGAPNQAGSLFIGLVVTLSSLGDVSVYAWMLIYMEAFAGDSLNLVNTMGNLTEIAVDAKKNKEMKWIYDNSSKL